MEKTEALKNALEITKLLIQAGKLSLNLDDRPGKILTVIKELTKGIQDIDTNAKDLPG